MNFHIGRDIEAARDNFRRGMKAARERAALNPPASPMPKKAAGSAPAASASSASAIDTSAGSAEAARWKTVLASPQYARNPGGATKLLEAGFKAADILVALDTASEIDRRATAMEAARAGADSAAVASARRWSAARRGEVIQTAPAPAAAAPVADPNHAAAVAAAKRFGAARRGGAWA
jgi:hypothetical protein